MFEEADAVGDARGFLTGTGHSSAFSEEGRAESALGPFPRPGATRPGISFGVRGLGARASGPDSGTGPGSARRFRFDSLGLLYKMSRRGKGREGGALARERRPAASGGRGRRQGPAGTHLCALRASCGCGPRWAGVRWGWGPEGQTDMPAAPLLDPEPSGSGRNVLFALCRPAWVYMFLAPGVCTWKHLFDIKEAACAAGRVRRERVAQSSRAVNESSPRGPGTGDSRGVHTRASSPRALTRGQRPFCSDDAWRGGEECMQKGGGLYIFFPPIPRCGRTLGVSASPDFPSLVSRAWKGYKIPPCSSNESVEEC